MQVRRYVWAFALLALLGAMGCTTTNRALRTMNERQKWEIEDLKSDKRRLGTQLKARDDQIENQSKDIVLLTTERDKLKEDLSKLQEQADREMVRQQTLKSKLVVALKSQPCEIATRGRDVIIRAKVGFIPGSVEMDKDGQKLLRATSDALRKAAPGCWLRIEGHTDNTPIQKAEYPTNWDLSGGRAVSVLRFLVERCGMEAEKMSFAGYGEHAPLVPNIDAKSQARNRRIEIVVRASK